MRYEVCFHVYRAPMHFSIYATLLHYFINNKIKKCIFTICGVVQCNTPTKNQYYDYILGHENDICIGATCVLIECIGTVWGAEQYQCTVQTFF